MEGWDTQENVVEGGTEGPPIDFAAMALAEEDFWGQVIWGAEGAVGGGGGGEGGGGAFELWWGVRVVVALEVGGEVELWEDLKQHQQI